MKRLINVTSLLLVLCMVLAFTACSSNTNTGTSATPTDSVSTNSSDTEESSTTTKETSTGTRIVTDMSGYDVELPEEVNSVIDLWHANNQVVLLLGGADKLIGTTEIVKGLAWYNYVYPRISEVPAYSLQSGNGNFNTEEILAANPDVVITSSEDDAEVLRNAGITTVVVTFRDFEGLKETVRITAEVLGDDAPERAEKFCSYFDENLNMLSELLGSLGDDEKPKVYQIRAEDPSSTDGKNSICTEWIESAGGINVAAQLTDDNMAEVVLEEVLNANPDIIIVAMQNPQPVVESLKSNEVWSSVKAIQDGEIYANPVGTFLWSRYSCEEALQVLWAAKTFHPDLLEDLDMVQTVQDFYKQFYDFDMSVDDAERMLQGLDPA